jgi:UDP:flavonoid glycosyltransferase YjiC (YdhE family)
MRVLMTTLPGVGHLHPLVPLGLELQARGHAVLVASAASFQPKIAASGLAGVAAGVDYRMGDEEQLVPALAAARARGDRTFLFTREVYAETVGKRMLPDVQRVVETWQPDVVVRDPVEFASCFVAEAAGIPHATGRENRFLPVAGWDAEAGDVLNELAALAGVDTDNAAGLLYRHLGLAPVLPSFVTASPVLPDEREFGCTVLDTMEFVRPAFFDGTLEDDVLPERAWNARSLVFASLGTVYNRQARLLNAMLEAGRGAPFELVVAVGGDQDPAQFRDVQDNVHVVRYVALSRILPHCSAVITAGGMCTVMSALEHAVPMVVVPMNAEHPTNALRCEALGVGIRIPPEEATADSLRDAATTVIEDPSFHERATEMQSEFRSLPAIDQAANLVEALV